MTADKELISLRDHLLNEVLRESGDEAIKVADELADLNPDVRKLVRQHRTAVKARQFIASGTPESPPPESGQDQPKIPGPDFSLLTLPEALALLDRTEYRLLRGRDDLLDVLVDVLTDVGKDAREDLALLYHPPKKGKRRKRLMEDALQAYVRRRLRDLLPQRIQTAPHEAVREDLVQLGERLDIRVITPVRGPEELAQAIIEVKWSDNKEVKSALDGQLGRRYLLREGKTHGIYLVGWVDAGSRIRNADAKLAGLQDFLTSQARDFTRAGSPGEGCRIEALVLDLSFPPKRTSSAKRQPRNSEKSQPTAKKRRPG